MSREDDVKRLAALAGTTPEGAILPPGTEGGINRDPNPAWINPRCSSTAASTAQAEPPRWRPIDADTSWTRELLLFFPGTPARTEPKRRGAIAPMRKIGCINEFPFRHPTHWMDPGEPHD